VLAAGGQAGWCEVVVDAMAAIPERHVTVEFDLAARSEHNMQRSVAPADERREQLVQRGGRQAGGQRALQPEPRCLPVAARP
jgi:hypothetical protein